MMIGLLLAIRVHNNVEIKFNCKDITGAYR